MAIRTYKVTLDTKNAIAPEPVYLRQGDKTGAVVIDAMLMDNGSPVSLSGLTPSFMANTADGKAVISDTTGFAIVDASGGEFTYQVPSQLGSVDGKIKIAYFSFSDSSGAQSTFNVVFVVEKAADMTQESAKDWASNLNDIINQYNQWVNDAHSSWDEFVNANKQIIESIDPGGKLLSEIVAARTPTGGHGSFDTIGHRMDRMATRFDTLSDLKASNTLADGDFALTSGFSTVNDGGSSLYKVVDSEADVPINGGNGLYAKLIPTHGIISLNQFGAIGDGIKDDTEAIQKCISYASSNGLRITSDKDKSYVISSPIKISGKFDIDLKGSTISSKSQVDSLLSIDCLSDDTAGERQSRLDNIYFDCANANVGVSVKARRVYLTNLLFLSVTNTGISLDGGYEISLSSSNFKGSSSSNATGISINTTDNFVSHCFGKDCHVFLVNNAEGNIIEGCHSWIWTESMLAGSIFIDMPSTGLISNCVSDTYETAFRLNPAGSSQIISNRLIISPTVYNSKTNSVPPTFIFWNGATDGITHIYGPTIANNWVSFPDASVSGFSKPGNLYNIQPWQVMCEINGNTGNNVPLFNLARTHLSMASDNITSRTSFALRKGMRVSGIVYCAFTPTLPTSQTVVATLPDGFRPAFQTPAYWIVGLNYNNLSRVAYGWIDQNGNISIANTSGDNAMSQGIMHISFDVYQPGLDLV
ncbi:BppU family phage baseplate upper protein [Lacticaseibacillus paracasei]|uniref:BppU family phage baseplate upper protein n=1 Tax=Lacticaseibacillus paracasei TaxID=1597 RepID=UPI000F0B047D|nr:BppU family phage baseplate upper protein [Lacticaseibacillus paracasei]RNE19092.1 Pectate lyase superfamily protein [Lacticaseibacillus paracasei]TLQ35171.1 DUF2479 domain-containing protein [Lacticaseibacillus paracasei]